MSRSVWIINRVGWDYDDNYYFRTESGGTPFQAYTDKDIAESFLKDLEAREIRDASGRLFLDFIRSEEYRLDVADNIEDLCKVLKLSYDGNEINFSKPINEYSDEELIDIADAFYISFFELVEVELVA